MSEQVGDYAAQASIDPVKYLTDQEHAAEIRLAYDRLCKVINAATVTGLKVKVFIDSSDTYSGGLVRSHAVTVTKNL